MQSGLIRVATEASRASRSISSQLERNARPISWDSHAGTPSRSVPSASIDPRYLIAVMRLSTLMSSRAKQPGGGGGDLDCRGHVLLSCVTGVAG